MDNSSTPLADYFWIAGVESISYNDPTPPQPTPSNLEDTIAEDSEHEDSDSELNATPSKRVARHSRQNSGGRTSNGRFSIHTLDEVDGNTRSNRSSATIRPTQAGPINGTSSPTNGASSPPGTGFNGLNGLNGFNGLNGDMPFVEGFDFDKALLKFAAERENFLEDLSFSAGAKAQAKPMVNPRAERIKAEEGDMSGRRSPLRSIERSIKGSIRRKMSFRDMNSMRKQPTTPRASTPGAGTIPRQGPSSFNTQPPSPCRPTNTLDPASIRTAKRLSNYNSVIPPPEPLNTDPDMHPLKRRFEPVLLDRYPAKDATDEISRRGKFPDYVPMFAFPNDIQIVSSDDRPRSTWHGFTMTSDDNSKIYGITIIIWTAITSEVADEVEQRCEQWRQSHMSNEERELAASLGVRLAAERAHLSQLLAKLPTIPSGSSARDILDDQISAVEEKISLMTEMLRPLRHGAASKIDGLTAGESGLWAPRAYGILGRDATRMSFWKEWLRAVVVPMTDGAILRVPPSSPKVGRWQPLERYVVNLCTEAFSPLSSKTQVELGVRELRLYCRKEATNEIPGARTIDIYALFRCLSIENIVTLYEYAMSESRIIFISSHTGMLHLACHALANLLYPLKWASIFIPVLPARLLSALDAPCPYIVGIERRYEKIELPDDDYVLVDLDMDTIDATAQPVRLPRQHRRKLVSLLHVAAPHHIRYGVTTGPPPYAMESYPYDAFSVENDTLFNSSVGSSSLGKWVAQNSSSFAEPDPPNTVRPPIFNAFLHSKGDHGKSDRPDTSKSGKTSPQSSVSPVSMNFPPMPTTPVSRSDSGFAQTLREKKSGHFDEKSRRSSSFGVDKHPPLHRPSLPFLNGHNASMSVSAISVDSQSSYGGYGGGYAPSTYAQSTIAASTIMPNMLIQPVRNTETTVWVEGHCFNWIAHDMSSTCTVCDDKSEGDGIYECAHCGAYAHSRCLGHASIVCSEAFHPDRVRAAFVRCLASLLYTYRKHLGRPNKDQKSNGQLYAFDMAGFVKSLPYDQQPYATMLRDTQAFNEFIHERETHSANHAAIRLFDEVIMAKKARGRPTLTSGLSRLSTLRMSHGASSNASGFAAPSKLKIPAYLGDTSDHMWRTASVPVPNAKFPGEYRTVVTRIPTKLDPALMREPRAIQGVPRPEQRRGGLLRKQVPSMVGSPPK
ncbi:DENN domain-containing protein [Colletotrichum karsti]|uniref:DENN domain-containing protein n=1 Tax=Colletotrichum karsti TaxID=1095194 RepID=A0A9P6LLH8_9PEZI|nr:DENN domain-containing protein [Colletotrichum karsti]KAF9877783.1 DENN domain-containing protein [Colletotrichum karsti]